MGMLQVQMMLEGLEEQKVSSEKLWAIYSHIVDYFFVVQTVGIWFQVSQVYQ